MAMPRKILRKTFSNPDFWALKRWDKPATLTKMESEAG
jgi:hypothetical protein